MATKHWPHPNLMIASAIVPNPESSRGWRNLLWRPRIWSPGCGLPTAALSNRDLARRWKTAGSFLFCAALPTFRMRPRNATLMYARAWSGVRPYFKRRVQGFFVTHRRILTSFGGNLPPALQTVTRLCIHTMQERNSPHLGLVANVATPECNRDLAPRLTAGPFSCQPC